MRGGELVGGDSPEGQSSKLPAVAVEGSTGRHEEEVGPFKTREHGAHGGPGPACQWARRWSARWAEEFVLPLLGGMLVGPVATAWEGKGEDTWRNGRRVRRRERELELEASTWLAEV